MTNNRDGDLNTTAKIAAFAAQDPRRAFTLDVELYQSYLDGTDLTSVQKQEFIESVWKIMLGFAELGFKIEPETAAQNSCGNTCKPAIEKADEPDDVVELRGRHTKTFNTAADASNDQREKEES